MTDEELKALVASLAIAQKETSEQMKDTDARMKETAAQMKKTDKIIKELSRQIGGLGNKFGSFTEGLAFPSMNKLLIERFNMDAVTTNYKVKRDGKIIELDVFAHSNGQLNKAFIVEIKSHLKEEHIEQILTQLQQVKTFLPEHANKQFFGILAGVHIPEQLKEKVLKAGIYLAMIHDENFELQTPDNFYAKSF